MDLLWRSFRLCELGEHILCCEHSLIQSMAGTNGKKYQLMGDKCNWISAFFARIRYIMRYDNINAGCEG